MIIERTPKISCLMVTTGRVDCLQRSVGCYLSQTYPNKELIVVSQGSDEVNHEIGQYLDGLQRSDILFETAPPHLTLGAMRNVSCELARGPVLCQWDDDDLYHPRRLFDQYQALRTHRSNAASAFGSFLKYFQHIQEIYWCDWSGEGCESCRLLPGSVMFYKRYFQKYQSLLYPVQGEQCHVEEDLNVLEKLLKCGRVVPVMGGHMYVYMFHGENTYNLAHHQLALDISSGKRVLSQEELMDREPLLISTFQGLGMDTLKVMSLDGLAFTYEP